MKNKKLIKSILLLVVLSLLGGCSILNSKTILSKSMINTFSLDNIEFINKGKIDIDVPNELIINDIERNILNNNKNINYYIKTISNKNNESIKYINKIILKSNNQNYNSDLFINNNKLLISNGKGWIDLSNELSNSISSFNQEREIESRIALHFIDNLDKNYLNKGDIETIKINNITHKTRTINLSLKNEDTHFLLKGLFNSIISDQKLLEILYNQKPISRDKMKNIKEDFNLKLEKYEKNIYFDTFNLKFYIDKNEHIKLINYKIKTTSKTTFNSSYIAFNIEGDIFINEIESSKFNKPNIEIKYKDIYSFILDFLIK